MDNYTLHIPAYTQAQTPIIVPEQAASITIIVGQHASGILHHVQKVSTEITITLEPYAHLQFVQSLAQEYNHQTKAICYQKENSSVIFNGHYRYSIQATLSFFLLGQQANANISCIIQGEHSAQSNFNTLQRHEAPDTISAVLLKGLLQDHARSTHTGMIHIDANAANTNATLQSRYLLIGNHAQAYAQPQLEVLNAQVECFHGSAIASCNDDDLFYLATRGVDTKDAQQLICDAFLQ